MLCFSPIFHIPPFTDILDSIQCKKFWYWAPDHKTCVRSNKLFCNL